MLRKRRKIKSLFGILFLIWLAPIAPPADASSATQNAPPTASGKSASKAFCGVRCLYAAALAEGITFSGTDLIRPEYIGSREGSSIEELERAAREHGLHTFAFVNGTTAALRAASHPVILHVESVPGSGRYDHFVLCLGHRDSDLLILDTVINPGDPARLVSPRDLELIWDGTGLIVSKKPIDGHELIAAAGEVVGWGGVVVCCIIAGQYGVSRSKRAMLWLRSMSTRARLAMEMIAIVVLALVSPAGAAWCTGSGILAHPQQIRSVEQAHIAQFLRRMPFAEADNVLAAGSAVFIDARYAVDFSNGHLPGAINIPVTTSASMVSAMLAGVGRDARLVVYCQSKSCPFSKVVAGDLLREGYTSVELLDGGWEEWSAWKH